MNKSIIKSVDDLLDKPNWRERNAPERSASLRTSSRREGVGNKWRYKAGNIDKDDRIEKVEKRDTRPEWFKRRPRKKAIISYGILAYTVEANPDGKKTIKYQLIQRRDTIAYIEFIRNKLDISEIERYVKLMTKEEIKRIYNCYKEDRLQDLWDELWVSRAGAFSREYKSAIKNLKINIENNILDKIEDVNIGLDELPWSFSKGRKHESESERECAMREFEEETKTPKSSLILLDMSPLSETYSGYDNKLYKTVLFPAYIDKDMIPETKYIGSRFRKYVTDETGDVQWMTYEEAIKKLDRAKIVILNTLNTMILNHFRKPVTGYQLSRSC